MPQLTAGTGPESCACRAVRRGGSNGVQEYIVVTLLVAATGKLDLPKVTSQEQLVTALNRLAALREDQVRDAPSSNSLSSLPA